MDQHVLYGPAEQNPEHQGSFGEYIHASLLQGGSKTAMIDAQSGQEITYSELRARTLRNAQYFKEIGLRESDVISLCGANSLDFFVPAIAALYLGITVAPISHSYVPREIVHALNISKPKLIVCSTAVVENIKKAAKEIPSVKKIIVYGKDGHTSKLECLDDLLSSRTELSSSQIAAVDLEHVAAILCSSGTTGLPKGVMLTHRNFLVCVGHLGRTGYGQLTPDSISMGILPFFHAFGFVMYLTNLLINMTLIVMPRFEEILFLSAIEKYKISFIALVPPLAVFLAKSPLVDRYDLSSLQEIICGAAPLSKDVQDLVKKRLQIGVVRQGYGLTETTLAVLITPPSCEKAGTSGILVPSMTAKVEDPTSGRSLPAFREGELCFRGPLVMKRYCGDVQATGATIDAAGWLHTGDLGYYDHDRYFFIVDRLKELIKYKGFQVPPAELEAILLKNPKIREAAVIGIPDETCGELPLAFVVKAPAANISEMDVIKYVEENVSYHKRLHGGVRFINEIPKNPSGKILRRLLRDSIKLQSKI